VSAWQRFLNMLPGVRLGLDPHGHCYRWDPWLVTAHVTADLAIACAYFAIPLTLYFIMRRVPLERAGTTVLSWLHRDERPPELVWVLRWFSLFILCCGLTHVIEAWTVFTPAYYVAAAVKLLTAYVSLKTWRGLIPIAYAAAQRATAGSPPEET
jgi:two-component system, NtrC family, sensor kinase